MSRKTIVNYTKQMDEHEKQVADSMPDMPRHALIAFVLDDWIPNLSDVPPDTLNHYLEQYVIGAYLRSSTARSIYRPDGDALDEKFTIIGDYLKSHPLFEHVSSTILKPSNAAKYNQTMIIALALARYASSLEEDRLHA